MSARRRLAAVEAPGPENGRPAARLPADVRQEIRALLARMLVEDYKQNPSVNQQVSEPKG